MLSLRNKNDGGTIGMYPKDSIPVFSFNDRGDPVMNHQLIAEILCSKDIKFSCVKSKLVPKVIKLIKEQLSLEIGVEDALIIAGIMRSKGFTVERHREPIIYFYGGKKSSHYFGKAKSRKR